MSINHYENFPVASFLLPARLRPAVQSIYFFARSADDIADEGDLSDNERLAGLSAYEDYLNQIEQRQELQLPEFNTLKNIIIQYQLPIQPLRDLLSAFKQDVVTKRYETYAQLLDYCNRSANPVGRLMLHLYQAATPQNCRDADAICSALQLINFWQDVAIDWDKQRIYVPLQDLAQFEVSEAHINAQRCDPKWQALMQFEVQRARELMLSGAALAPRLKGRIGVELCAVVQGGLRILEKIERNQFDVFTRRPTITKWDALVIGWRSVWMKIKAF